MNSESIKNIVNSIDSMTPNNDTHDSEIYIELFNDGICNREDTTNIALSGPYGAGKSTILHKFKELNALKEDDDETKKRFLNISMASFNEYKDKEEPKKQVEEVDIKAIEKSILQQMFYSVSEDELPLSKFNRISNINKEEIENKTLDIILWLSSIVLFFSLSNVQTTFQDLSYGNYIYYIVFILISFSAVYLTKKNISNLYYQIKKLNLSKIVFKNTEVIFSENKNSVLNSNIDEILYFFEVTKTDVMIIEDIDRFNHPEIFVNLRELNYQINNSHQVPQKVTFIYAVKEDMFKNEDRVKFFDLIVPVIPFINSENSNEMISNKFKKLKLDNKISKDFITGISLFISDMRLLTNIINEFLVYYSKLSNTTNNNLDEQNAIDLEKLFAVIIYKNFHPDDFAKLHKRKGDLFNLIHVNKKEIISSLTGKVQEEIQKIIEEKDEAQGIIFDSINEFRVAFMLQFGYKNNINQIKINNQAYSLIDIAKDLKLLNELQEITNVQCIEHNDNYWRNKNISQIFKNAMTEFDFLKRNELLQTRLNKEKNSFDIKIEHLNTKKSKCINMNIAELITIDGNSAFIPKSISESEILYYLIINEYLGEDYSSYISLIHDLSENEISFLRKVKNAHETDVIEQLHNIEAVINKLSKKDFSKFSILNIYLVQYLIANIKDYQQEYNDVLELLKEYNDEVNDFIYFFITSSFPQRKYFINSLIRNRVDLWDSLSDEYLQEGFSEYDWLKLIFNDVDLENIYKLNSKSRGLSNCIEEMSNFIEFVVVNKLPIEKVKAFMKKSEIKLQQLNVSKNANEKDLFDFICDNNLYFIEKDTLKLVIEHSENSTVSYEDAVSYTKISSLKNTKIIEYIDDNIDTYIGAAYMQLPHKESLESIKNILDNPKLNDIHRNNIIKDMDNIIDDIGFIDEISWNYLLEYKKIKPTWENVLQVYREDDNSITKELLAYLNQTDICIELKDQSLVIVKGYEEEKDIKYLKDFRNQLYFKNNLSNENLKLYRSTSDRCWNSLDLSSFDIKRIETIVEAGYLCTEATNFNNLKANTIIQKPLHIDLIEQNSHKFFKDIPEYNVSSKDIGLILNSSKLNNEIKVSVMMYYGIDKVIDKTPIEFNKYFILDSSIEDQDERIALIMNQLDYLDKTEALELVSMLDDRYKKVLSKRHFDVKMNDINYEFARALESKGFVGTVVPVAGKGSGWLRIFTAKKKDK